MLPAFLVLAGLQALDFSTPEATVRNLLKAIGDHDAAGVSACVLGGRNLDRPMTGPKTTLGLTSFFAVPDGDDTVRAGVEFTLEWPNGQPGGRSFRSSLADVLRLRRVEGRWLLVPPVESIGALAYGGRVLQSAVAETVFTPPPRPPDIAPPQPPTPPSEREMRKQRAEEDAFVRADLLAAAKRVVLDAVAHGGRLPVNARTVSQRKLLRHLPPRPEGFTPWAKITLNPKLYGRTLASLPSGTVLISNEPLGYPMAEVDGRFTVVVLGRGKPQIARLTRAELRRGPFGR